MLRVVRKYLSLSNSSVISCKNHRFQKGSTALEI
jgi:hypothetical protein